MPFVIPWGYVWRTYVNGARRPLALRGRAASFWGRGEQEASLGRLYVIRAAALLGIWGLFPTVETLIDHAAADRGLHKALISGLWVNVPFRLPLPAQDGSDPSV